jgi:hypothetical protein
MNKSGRRYGGFARWFIGFCLVLSCCNSLWRPRTATAATDQPLQPLPTSQKTPSLALTGQNPLTKLVEQADAVVRGRVITITAGWHPQQRLIESTVVIAVSYHLLGGTTATVTVKTPGGFLADEGIGMVSPHAAAFTPGEEVLLFLRQQGPAWQVINGAAGKFQLLGQQVLNDDLRIVANLDSFLVNVTALCATRTAADQNTPLWGATLLPVTPSLGARAATAPTSDRHHKWASPHAGATYYVNPNSSQVSSAAAVDQLRRAISAAAGKWSAVASADFALHDGGVTTATTTGYNGVNEILFMHKGATERGAAAEVWYKADLTIVEADIWINDDYRWSVTGTPAADAVDLESALVHEFGHWLILNHTAQTGSVMYPRLAPGAVKRSLGEEDVAGISAIYPR